MPYFKKKPMSKLSKAIYLIGLLPLLLIVEAIALNYIGKAIGIEKPFTHPVTHILVGIPLLIILYKFIRSKPQLHRYHAIFLMLPLVVFGGLWINYGGGNSTILMLGIAIVLIASLWMMLRHEVKTGVYALFLYVATLSLLYAGTLYSFVPMGYDSMAEYYYAFLTMSGGISLARDTNLSLALAVTALTPLLSSGLNITFVLLSKAVYPLMWSLMPVMSFMAFRNLIGDRRAFIACIVIIAIFTQGGDIRVCFSAFYLAMAMMVLMDKGLTTLIKVLLLAASSTGLVVCYYTTSLLFLAYMGMGGGIATLAYVVHKGIGRKVCKQGVALLVTIALLAGGTCLWVNYAGSGSIIKSVEIIAEQQREQVIEREAPEPIMVSSSKLIEPNLREQLIHTALGLDFATATPWGKMFRIILYTVELLVAVGVLRYLFRRKEYLHEWQYAGIGLVAVGMLGACVVLPTLSSHWEAVKFYMFAMYVLVPVMVVGAEVIIQRKGQLLLLSLLVIGYFAYMSGFVFEATQSTSYNRVDMPSSEALSGQRIDAKVCSRADREAVKWLSGTIKDGDKIYGDHYACLFLGGIRWDIAFNIPLEGEIQDDAYIYLREWNTSSRTLTFIAVDGNIVSFNTYRMDSVRPLQDAIKKRELIYDKDNVLIYGEAAGVTDEN